MEKILFTVIYKYLKIMNKYVYSNQDSAEYMQSMPYTNDNQIKLLNIHD